MMLVEILFDIFLSIYTSLGFGTKEKKEQQR